MTSPTHHHRPWTKKETVIHQAAAIQRIPSTFSECVTSAIIDLIQKHFTSDRISSNTLYQHAMRDLTSPEAQIHITEVMAMRCMNGGHVPPLWKERCHERGLTEYVDKEIRYLEQGLCICEKRSAAVHLGGCRNSQFDREKAMAASAGPNSIS